MTPAQQTRPTGKALHAAVVARQSQREQQEQPEDFGIWQTLEGIATLAFDRIAKLEAEVAELRGTKSATTAKAPAQKPLRLALVREITDKTVAPLVAKIEAAHGREIKLSLEFPGGHVDAARKLCRAIENHGACDTHAISACDSAATLVFAAGRRRSALKGCTFHVHAPHLNGKPADTPADKRRLDRVAKDMAAYLHKRTGKSAATWARHMSPAGVTLDAIQASNLQLLNAAIKRPHVPKAKGRSR